MTSVIRAVRVYGLSDAESGARWLVDRVWPRGVPKTSLKLAGWAREAAPSDELRRWFDHDASRWTEFDRRYTSELDASPAAWRPLQDAARGGDLILLYAARDTQHNNAVALRDYLRRQVDVPALLDLADEHGGDPVCWLHQTCPDCGHLPDNPAVSTCPRCGALLERDNEA